MLYWVNTFDIDGYRGGVGDEIPLDFWKESISEVKNIKPDFLMLNEGIKPEYIDGVFDTNYNFSWSFRLNEVILGQKTAECIVAQDEENRERYGNINMSCLI